MKNLQQVAGRLQKASIAASSLDRRIAYAYLGGFTLGAWFTGAGWGWMVAWAVLSIAYLLFPGPPRPKKVSS